MGRRLAAAVFAMCALALNGVSLRGQGPGAVFHASAARTDSAPAWPDTLIVNEMRVAPLAPGVVYGMSRYRGVVQGKASVGISERVFVKTPAGWKISYTASFPDTLPP